jgi:large subunit ribosomal protein L5
MSELKKTYQKEIVPKLKKDLGLKNVLMVPKVTKVVVNVGIGTFMKNNKDYKQISNDLALLTGQAPELKKARMSVSNFKLREGMPNGLRVTLRGEHMYDFLYKVVNIVLPRVRDFQGIPNNSFDGNGNYTLGLKDHSIFPEIQVGDETKNFGLEITIVTSTKEDEQAKVLLETLGFPFKKNKAQPKVNQ